jgi:hypothetical protein
MEMDQCGDPLTQELLRPKMGLLAGYLNSAASAANRRSSAFQAINGSDKARPDLSQSAADFLEIPVGNVPVDDALSGVIRRAPHVVDVCGAYRQEHPENDPKNQPHGYPVNLRPSGQTRILPRTTLAYPERCSRKVSSKQCRLCNDCNVSNWWQCRSHPSENL